MNRQERGGAAEKLACAALKKKGYRILDKNYRCRYGEIDIVARHKDSLVFVEVRSKSGGDFGTPEESITSAKKQRLVSSAFDYLGNHGKANENWRFDFVSVQFAEGSRKGATVQILQNIIC